MDLLEQYADKITVDATFPAVDSTTDTWARLIQSKPKRGWGWVEVQSNDAWTLVRLRQRIYGVDVDTYECIGPSSSVIMRVPPVFSVECKATAAGTGGTVLGFSDIGGFNDAVSVDPYITVRWSHERPHEADTFSVSTGAAAATLTGPTAIGTSLSGYLRPVKTLRRLTFCASRETVIRLYGIPDFGGSPLDTFTQPANVPFTIDMGGFGTLLVSNGAIGTCHYRADWRKGVA